MLDMEKAEKVKKALRVRMTPECKGCKYEAECGAGETLYEDALEIIEEMEKALKMFVPLEGDDGQ